MARAKTKAKATKSKAVKKAVEPTLEKAPATAAAPASVNKSQAVRDALAKDSAATPKEISAKLKEQGISVQPSYVSLIKWQAKQSKAKKGAAAASSAAPSPGGKGGDTITIASLIQAKKLAEALGGVEIARQALHALNKLVG